MTKSELLEALKDWPDDAEIEISVPKDLNHPKTGDRIWFEIDGVEPSDEEELNEHCLLYVGDVTMA